MGLDEKKQLVIPAGATKDDLQAVIKGLVESGKVSVDVVNASLGKIGQVVPVVPEKAPVKCLESLCDATIGGVEVLTPKQQEELLGVLKARFEVNIKMHGNIKWDDVEKALKANPKSLVTIKNMEDTGGEVDVLKDEGADFLFTDFSDESPIGRRNVVYDKSAEESLKKNYPEEPCSGNMIDIVTKWGAEVMDETQYRALHALKQVDKKTWGWIKTPVATREKGVALYGRLLGSFVRVRECSAFAHFQAANRGFRCLARVKKG
jgi:hypothetical protein